MIHFSHLSKFSSIEHGITEVGDTVPDSVQGEQVHRNVVAWVANAAQPVMRGADALLTKQADLTLGVRVADCIPILIAEPHAGVVGTIHAGWRGTALEVTLKTIEALKMRPNRLLVGIGPGICRNCFEVGPEVARQFADSVVRASEKEEDKFFVDLQQANIDQCLEMGVPERNIETVDLCTFESDRLFSFRQGDREQRNVAFIQRLSSRGT